ncbi:MaoC/PaaZ C-terminal domain-containing protein [Pseudoteredinibacter isoporae]|uniref:Acyl dehydratase n=1 Tax=Pseudoteredinibacter isoporae TaxID=570281 RepID=A0A7X0JSD9_9GAMM|nr:MaoC/PaaZ C-terminal domain-containing protein [Pseudoteredinibacter isoporae]MBB6521435.1 acyl dehydratase [Pseudoteredinibacter isoporae]NHO86989.1 dehydratase [Pseudoteredinibacter isoporae]NIB24558.1 dehydratase [Pseudoteredinibacter isoporae]
MTEQLVFRSRWFEDIPVGEFHVFGSHTFGEKEIIDFGKRYAPQPYHTDPEAALGTRYRGLVASGWHISAIWMKLMVTYMERYATGVRDGRRNGAGVGFQNMKWLKPVRPGHTLTYTYEITDKLEKIVRGQWGIIRSRNEAYNQYGELVFTFEIDILAELNPDNRA